MIKYRYLIDIAINYCKKYSKIKNKSRHCCIIFNSKFKILSISYNYKDIHAEDYAINKNNKGKNLLVIRINSNNELLYSKPCFDCIKKLKDTNIKYIIFSISNNQLEKIKTRDIFNNHRSYFNKINNN